MSKFPTYRKRTHSRSHRKPSAIDLLIGAGIVGAAVGVGSIATTPEGRSTIFAAAKDVGVETGLVRERAPQEGDYWRRCDEARAAGSAPIYRGEPGYRQGLDGDYDGIACEPYHGQ